MNRELFVLEEELVPANTQVAVFISMDVGDFFAWTTVTLKSIRRKSSTTLHAPRSRSPA